MGKLFDGRTAIVTGAARGVGRGVALYLAEHGCNIVAADPGPALNGGGTDTSLIEDLHRDIDARGAGCLTVGTDITDRVQVAALVDEAVDRFGAVDILVNNAGNMRYGWSWEVGEDDFASVVGVHLLGQFNCIRRVLPGMLDRGYGRILNMTSRGSLGQPLNAAYSAAKAGVLGMTAAIAVEVEGRGVTVNAFGPSAMSRMSSYAIGMSDVELREAPINDAPFVAYLVSEGAGHVSGQIFLSGTGKAGVVDLFQRPSQVAQIVNPAGENVAFELDAVGPAFEQTFGPHYVHPGALTREMAENYVAKTTKAHGIVNHWAEGDALTASS